MAILKNFFKRNDSATSGYVYEAKARELELMSEFLNI
ncbi:hypothetical protein JOD55_000914 [Arcanobacterium pluranimalium]|nr:hypothetical protein [Arcanobacterium pluranimalium]